MRDQVEIIEIRRSVGTTPTGVDIWADVIQPVPLLVMSKYAIIPNEIDEDIILECGPL